MTRDTRISRALNYVLRHAAAHYGLQLHTAGYAQLGAVLRTNALRVHRATPRDVERIVRDGDKKRFSLVRDLNDPTWVTIRDTHANSLQLDSVEAYQEVSLSDHCTPELLIHGAKNRHLEAILQEGLLAGGRQHGRDHIFFNAFHPTMVRCKLGSEVGVVIRLQDLYKAGMTVYHQPGTQHAHAEADGRPLPPTSSSCFFTGGINGVITPDLFETVLDLATGLRIH